VNKKEIYIIIFVYNILPEVNLADVDETKSITMDFILHFLLFSLLFYTVHTKEEQLSDLYSMLDKPGLLSMIEKRLKLLEDENTPEAGCFDNSGSVEECEFTASNGTIIKTTESLAKGATFLEQFSNISCPRDCFALCCENPACDTSVYQDKV